MTTQSLNEDWGWFVDIERDAYPVYSQPIPQIKYSKPSYYSHMEPIVETGYDDCRELDMEEGIMDHRFFATDQPLATDSQGGQGEKNVFQYVYQGLAQTGRVIDEIYRALVPVE